MNALAGTFRRVGVAFLLATAGMALVGTIVVGVAPAASAHSVLVSSTPASGATVATPPSTITLTFNENVRAPAYVVVTGPDGRRVDEGSARILDATVTEQLKATAPAGSYTVAYRVVSADGHPVEDQLTYTVAAGAQPASAATPPSSTDDGGHSWHVLGGLAVVIAGVAALVYERLQRRRHPAESASPR
jgi:copper resistance protein C